MMRVIHTLWSWRGLVAFAFCHLLGFRLLPRLKNIASQKLSRPEAGSPSDYQNLQPILTKVINWELIRNQYDEMVKFSRVCFSR